MASDESRTVVSSKQDDVYDDIDVGFHHDDHQPHPRNFSRLSMSTSSIDTDDDDMRMSSEEDFSGEELSSDSNEETCYLSLPSIPYHRRNRIRMSSKQFKGAVKDYGTHKGSCSDKEIKSSSNNKCEGLTLGYSNCNRSRFRGESTVIITRPKGGRRPLRMDMEEVKACRDLGFELEHERMLKMPSRGARSLIAADSRISASDDLSLLRNLRDDPNDVKALLKVWAQAVALASKSMYCTTQA